MIKNIIRFSPIIILFLFILLVPSVTAVSSADIEFCYDMDESSSATVITDDSGNGYNATKTTGSVTSDTGANCADGVSCLQLSSAVFNVTNYPVSLNTTEGFTQCIWVKPSSTAGNQRYTNVETGGSSYFYFRQISANLNTDMSDGSTSIFASTNTNPITASSWNSVCLVVENGVANYYVNNVLKAPASPTNGNFTTTPTGGFYLFGKHTGTEFLTGTVDTYTNFNKALSTSELTEWYNSGTARECSYYVSSDTYVSIRIQDIYDNANLENLTVTLNNGISNTTGSDGIAHFENYTTQSFNVTDSNGLYFNYNSSSNPTENTTTTYKVYGAFVNLTAYNLINDTLSSFNTSSGSQTNTTSTGSLLMYLRPNATNTLNVTAPNYLPLLFNISTTGQDTGSYNITGLYQTVLNITGLDLTDSSTIQNFTVNYTGDISGSESTTVSSIAINLMLGNTTVIFDASGYALDNITLNLTSSAESYEFEVYTTNSINFSFYDEETGVLIQPETVYLELISTLQSGNYTTTTGSIYEDLLSPDTYTLRFNSLGYANNFYALTLTDRTFTALNLTLLNSSSATEVTVTVYDTIGNLIEGAYVKVLKFDINTGLYTIVEIVETNFQGVAKINVLQNSEYYQFIIDYQGETRLTTNPTYIYGTDLSFFIPIVSSGMNDFFEEANIQGNIEFDYTNNIATFTYNDLDNTATQGCFYAYRYTGTGNTLLNTSCSSSSSGSLYLSAFNSTTSWYFKGEVTKGGTTSVISTYRVDFITTIEENGSGIFYAFLVLAVLVFIGIYSLELAVILAGLVPLLFSVMKIASLEYVVTIPVFIASVIMAAILGYNKK